MLLLAPVVLANEVEPLTVNARRGAGYEVVETNLPGRWNDSAIARSADGRERLLLLVDPRPPLVPDSEGVTPRRLPLCPGDVGERLLVEAALVEGDAPRVLRDDLPNDAWDLEAYDLDGDGDDELLLSREDGSLVRLGASHAEDRVIVTPRGYPRFGFRSLVRGTPWFPRWDADGLKVFRADGGEMRRVASATTRRNAQMFGKQIQVWPDPIRFAGERQDGGLSFVSVPFGRDRRARADLIDVGADGTTTQVEAWMRFPEPERVLTGHALLYRDEPHLLVETVPADKAGVGTEKRLRLFPVREDETRLGVAPIWSTRSSINAWEEVDFDVRDVDGDGVDDLVLGYWTGLARGKVVLDVYLGNAEGSFSTKARTTDFKVKKADRGLMNHVDDIDGDGREDLLVATEQGFQFHRGVGGRRGANIVESRKLEIPVEYDFDDTSLRLGVRALADGPIVIARRSASREHAESIIVLRLRPTN